MTTQTTTEESRGGAWTLVGTCTFTLLVLAGAALWLVWAGGEAATAPTTAPVTAARAGTPRMGGLAQPHPEDQRALSRPDAADVTTRGGLAELYAEQEAAANGAPGASARRLTTNGMPERDGEQAGAVVRSVYLVGSEDAATAARQRAARADQVHVVATEEEASHVRVGLSGPGTTIIDLRTLADGARGACGQAVGLADC